MAESSTARRQDAGRVKRCLAWTVVALATVAMLTPLFPAGKKAPFGLGSFWPVLEFNRVAAAGSPHAPDTRARLRFLGQFGKQKIALLKKAVEQVHSMSGKKDLADLRVQVRGLARNESWVLAYDLYPVKVIGRYADQGGRPNDPVLPQADWVLTQRKRGQIVLERTP